MLLSAVSSGLALVALATGQQLDSSDKAVWQRIEPTIVRIMNGVTPVGSAVLIDNTGYFLAHRGVGSAPVLFGKLSNGQPIQLTVTAVDEVTQLALLHAEGWRPTNRAPAAVQDYASRYVQEASPKNSTRVVIVLPDRAIRGELTTSNLVGVMAPSRRGLTLSEIRFENPMTQFGGGLAFTQDGKLVGVLGATLEAGTGRREANTYASKSVSGVGGGGAAFLAPAGPSTLTVSYSISPDLISRVVQDFLSPSHVVNHPALGLMCSDSGMGGALVVSVVANSVAAEAGLRPNDIITEMAGEKVTDQVAYTRILVRQRVGDTINLIVKRGSESLTIPVKVGK